MTNTTSGAGPFGYLYPAPFTYHASRITLPNSAYITNAFDSGARLTGTYLKNSAGTVLNAHEYVVNTAGQRTRQTRVHGDYVDYTYDNAGQLLTALGRETGGTTSRLNEQLRYVYDPAGNLNWRTNNALAQQFAVNNLNELTSVGRTANSTLTVAGNTTSPATNATVNGQGAAVYGDNTFARDGFTLADGNNTFTAIAQDARGNKDRNVVTSFMPAQVSLAYDLNGNLRTNGSQVLDYDDENQLTSVTVSNAWRSEFVYDGKNRRRIERDYGWQPVGATWQLTNEFHLVYDGNVILQQRTGLNVPALTLTRGLDLSGSLQGAGGIGGLLAMTEASGTNTCYHADGGGNVTCLVNASQLITARAGYDPYGRFLFCTGPAASVNPFWYSSKPLHARSGYYDFLYRWYAPELQRWVNRDPIAELGGIHQYAYSSNSPVDESDAWGLSVVGKVVIFVAKGTAKGEKVIAKIRDVKEAMRLQQEGEEVIMSSEKAARELARDAGGGATPIKEFDEAAQRWHYHPADRSGGHILYGVAAALTLAHYAQGQAPVVQTAAEVADIANPLSLLQDALSVYDFINDAFNGAPIEDAPVHTFTDPCGRLYIGRHPPTGYRFKF